MFTPKKWDQLDQIHDLFSVPVAARISNRVVFQRHNDVLQEYLMVVGLDNQVVVLPLEKGVPTKQLPENVRMIFLVKNKREKLTFTVINLVYAKRLISKPPSELPEDKGELIKQVVRTLKKSFYSNSLPELEFENPHNWYSLCMVFQNQDNDVMTSFISEAIVSYEAVLIK